MIGQPVPRVEDARFLTGHGRFVDDLQLPGTAYACVVRSPHAHARIRGIDSGIARKSAGDLDFGDHADAGDARARVARNS
jgi:carbon-monoxide dehydrogenase large subunit